jgi:hypothetical protein
MPSTENQDQEPQPKFPQQLVDEKYAPSSWATGTGQGNFEDLEVPSGQLCLVRRPGVQGLIEAGVLQDFDTLSAIVSEKHLKRVKGKPEVDVESLMKDSTNILNVMRLTEKIVCYTVVKPQVKPTPNDVTNRKQSDGSWVYADQIDIEDQMFILNYAVGGTRSVERFHEESENALGNVQDSQGVRKAAKRSTIHKG